MIALPLPSGSQGAQAPELGYSALEGASSNLAPRAAANAIVSAASVPAQLTEAEVAGIVAARLAESHTAKFEAPPALTEDEMDAALAEAGWPADLRHAAKCTFWRESRWRPGAVSPTNDHGLAQLNGFWATFFGAEWEHRYEPVANLRMALVVYQRGGGWGPWRAAC